MDRRKLFVADLNRYQTSSILAPNEQITFVSSSDFGVYDAVAGGIVAFGTSNRSEVSWTPIDFVRLNKVIYEPVTASSNLLGYPLTAKYISGDNPASPGSYFNDDFGLIIHGGTPVEVFLDEGTGGGAALNALLLHRNGPYGFPSWKAIRKHDNPIIISHRETNIISYITENKSFNNNGFTITTPTLSNVTQSAVSTTKPLFIQLSDTSFDFKSSYENQKIGFTNTDLQTYAGDFTKKTQKNSTFLERVIKQKDINIRKLTIKNTIYPKTDFQFLNATRTRDVFDNQWWRTDRLDRVLSSVTNSFGFPLGANPTLFADNKQSRWSMDARDDFLTTIPATGTGSQHISGSGELQNSYSTFHFFPSDTLGSSEDIFAPLYARKTISFIYETGGTAGADSSVTGGYLNAGDALWEVATQSGKEPFYNSYAAYAEELRMQGKDYSIVPEFRIDDHIETYLSNGFDFKAQQATFLSLTGTSNTDIASRYSAAELSDVLGTVQAQTKLGITKFGLKARAYLKLLPYEGFYPQQRTLQLAAELSRSYSDVLEGYDDSGKSLVNPKRYFYEPYVMPGILFNTIKSGLAVDYPLYRKADSTFAQYQAGIMNIVSGGTDFYGNWFTKEVLNQTGSLYSTYTTQLDSLRDSQIAPYSSSYPFLNKFLGISSGFQGTVDRIPFKALLDPYSNFRGTYEQFDPNNLACTTGTFASLSGIPKINYTLAMNNFLAETTNFFLYRGLTSFESKAQDLFTFDTSKQYVMDFTLTNSNITSVSQYTNRLLRLYPDLEGSDPIGDMFLNSSVSLTPSASCVMYNRNDAFGFPSLVTYRSASGATMDTPRFTNFTPPYYSGFARARYTFQPTEKQHTMGEIISAMTITHYRASDNPLSVLVNDPSFDADYDLAEASTSDQMYLDSSFTLDAVVETKKPSYDANGDPVGFEEFDTPREKLVIHSKYECPVLNYKDVDASQPAYDTTTKGMWHQYGEIPNYSDTSIFSQVNDMPDAEKTYAPATASLISVLGMETDRKAIGRLADTRQVEEALVVLPYYKDTTTLPSQERFFELTAKAAEKMLKKANRPSVNINDDQIVRQVRLMKKYVFPPL